MIVFVYGTLMRGGRYHGLIAHSERLGPARTAHGFALVDLGPYPAMIAGEGSVAGELYRVDAATLAALDELEGHPSYYQRTPIRLADGREVVAYLFVDRAALAEASPIPGGDWRSRAK